MTFPAAPRRAPALKPLAIATALALSLCATVHAEETLPTVTITGARFASDPALAPIGATVISADDIRRTGVADVNEAIRKIGGVYGRQNTDGSSDFALDLRGFSSNGSQNMVVTLDGVRLSENELTGAVLSVIPIETIERIEIIRGGASVLFGEGATAGVIQIITKRPSSNTRRASVRAEAGQFGLADLRASYAQSWDGFALDAALGSKRTDNYRDNNGFEQQTFSGGLQWAYRGGRAGVRVDVARQESELAGSLTMAQFQANPRQANTPKDSGKLDSDRVTAFVEQRFGSVDLAAELSHREKQAETKYYSGSGAGESVYPVNFDSKQTQFSPRMRHLARFDGMLNEVVAGVDLIDWERTDTNSTAKARQKSTGVYVRDELKFDAAHNGRLSAGVRHESFDKQDYNPFVPATEHAKQSHNAWEVQGSFDVAPMINLYAKTGRSFRVPNSDENGFRSSTGVLAFQRSRDLELGVTLGDAKRGVTARAFQHDLTDEIFYDPTADGPYGRGTGANTNLDPTKRSGVELDGHIALGANLRLNGTLQHVNARFTEGPNAGRDMVLVPKNVLTARLSWVPGNGQSADIGGQWVDSQRYGSDFSNACSSQMPSYATFDARYARQLGAWEFAVSALNLGDKQYFSNAFGCRSAIYPSDGRQLKVSARFDF
jgi:iron complex outermembrane receptor protein